ncbi:MAG: hypothetical protein J6V40_03350, partial [Clostridia bacterium]|nr:hypothetical protein [Clostridia bacterium]
YKLGVLGGTLQAGLYDATLTVKVVDSYYGNEYVNSVDDPYYLFATSTTTSYTIVDGATCQFKYQDKNLIWTDMSAEIANLGAYTLKYKVAGSEGDYALLADNIITNSYGNFASLSSNAYEFQLTINPSYSYSQDKIGINYILTNNILTINNITKLETVQVAGTFDGGFYFNSPDLSRDNTYEIYKNNMLQVNNTDYIITETITNTTNYTYYVKFNFNLQESVNFTFRVSAANCIDSDMSTTFNVRPILVPTLSNVTARDTSNNLVHMLKWANTSDQISHFILRQISPSLSTTLHVTDAVTSFDNDYLDGFYLVDGYYYYVFDDTTIVNAGTYRYTIKAYTTTSGYLNSNDSVESLIVKLSNTASMSVVNGSVVIEQPTGLNISNTYKLNITLYTIDSETQEKVYDDTHSKELTLTTSYTHTVDFGDYDELSEQGAYAITVQYIGGYEVVDQGTQKTVYYIDSNLSAEKYVIKAGKPSVYMLNGAVAWTNPIGSVATSINYDVKITNTVDSTEHYSLTTTGTELTNALINEHNINFAENSTYTVTVSANTSGYISSEMSDAYTVIKLIKAEDFRIDVEMGTTEEDDEGNLIEVSTKVFKWANNNPRFREDDEGLYVKVGENYVLYDESATAHETLQRYSYTTTSYKIFYVDGEGNEVAVQTVGDNLNVISQSINTALVVGEYTCYMQIIGSTDLNTMSVGYISSDISNKVTLSIRQESESVRVVNNQLAWDTVDGAYAYRVVFDYLGTDTSVTQGFSIHTRECLLDLGATEMSNYNVFGMYEVKVFAYTGHTESNSYLITTNTSDEYGYNQKNKLSLFKADSVVDYKILDGMFSWSFSLESINKYLEYNQINVSLLKEGGFETGLEENIEREYTDIEKNQVRAIRYIQGRINGTIPADENLDKALSPYLNFKMKVNGVEIEVTPSKIEGLNGEGIPVDFKPATYLSATKVRYYYDLVRDNKDSETLNVTTGFYDVYVASYGNTNLPTEANTAIVSSNYSDVKKVYKPSTPIAATANDLYSDIVDSNVYWNLVTTDNTLMGSAEFFA